MAKQINNTYAVKGFFALSAKNAQSGDWVSSQTEAVDLARGKRVPEEIIEECLHLTPFDPIKRCQLLANQFFSREGWEQWASLWATTSEVENVRQNAPTKILPPALGTIAYEPTAIAPAPPSFPDRVTTAVYPIGEPASPLIARGMAIEVGFKEFGLQVEFSPGESNDAGLRCDRMVFSKPVGMPFAAPQKFLSEALSNAGVDPEAGVIFKKLTANRFEMQIPRPSTEWKDAHLLQFLCDRGGVQIMKQASLTFEDKLLALSSHLRTSHNVLPQNFPRLPASVDLDGNVYWLNLASHVLISGGSNGGKSTLIKTLLSSLILLYPPEWAEFCLMDFKQGVTLTPFANTDWSWRGKGACSSPDLAGALWEELHGEAKLRAEKIVAAGVENLAEYNTLYPNSPIPWLFVIIDEIGNYKQAKGDEADAWLQLCMSQWRAWGIICIGSTQYPSAKHAISPDTRTNFMTKVLFACDERCAKLVLGESDRHAIEATRLIPPGDCLIKAGGNYIRGQALYLAAPVTKALLKLHDSHANPFGSATLERAMEKSLAAV